METREASSTRHQYPANEGKRMNMDPDTLPEHHDLAALLQDPNLLPSERDALTRLLATTMALEALAPDEQR